MLSPMTDGAPRRTLTRLLIRVVHLLVVTGVFLHAALVCLQPVLAGLSLDGDGTAFELHGINGSIVLTLTMILVPLGLLWWRPGRGTFWVPALAAILFTAESMQLGLGYAGTFTAHVPLGVAIIAGSLVLCRFVLRTPAGASPRPGPAPI